MNTTLNALELLVGGLRQTEVDWSIFLVDDGSTDGTADLVRERYPFITVSVGGGDLYWNGGMCLAYASARRVGSFDRYLLFNDDVSVDRELVPRILAQFDELNQETPTIVVGSTSDPDDSRVITYSGMNETSRIRALSFTQVDPWAGSFDCDTFNGNFVLIPGGFFESVGGLDPKYCHGLGDIDLGLVAKRFGVRSRVFDVPVGTCSRNPSNGPRSRSFRARWRKVFSYPNGLRPYAHFCWKNRPRVLFPVYVSLQVARRLNGVFSRSASV